MAVPKSRTSRSRTRSRRAQWQAKAQPSDLVTVRVDGESRRVPRRLVRAVHRHYVDPGDDR